MKGRYALNLQLISNTTLIPEIAIFPSPASPTNRRPRGKEAQATTAARNDERSDQEYVEAGDGASSDASEHVEATQPSVPPIQAALAIVPSILGKTFESTAAFFAFWEQFEWQNFVVYHTRDCQMAHGKHTNRPDLQVPPHFGYAFRKYACTLGCQQKSRSTGKWAKHMERYRDCKATF
ncbi:hypothetical protein PI124_g20094 [Phytophthora idaei]|nr:hypothetical protein PI125_g8578 [Phytophthora idaei]KAG3234860.1 hypothetical protein PI124_g20094 [Phytophthora idaei]